MTDARPLPRARALPAALLLFAGLTACNSYSFKAERSETLDFPAQLQTVNAATHNGDITVRGSESAQGIWVVAKLQARGATQEEADQNLSLLRVAHEIKDGALYLTKSFEGSSSIPTSISFVIECPSSLRPTLETHNGDIKIDGLRTAIACETHNGDVDIADAHSDVRAKTHNGNLRISGLTQNVTLTTHNGDAHLELAAPGPLAGRIETHNGNVQVTTHSETAVAITASTHNGHIGLERDGDVRHSSRRALECSLQGGTSKLQLESYNGDVTIR